MSLSPGTELSGTGIGSKAVSAEVFRVKARPQAAASSRSGSAQDEVAALSASIGGVVLELKQISVTAGANSPEILLALSRMIQDPELFALASNHIEKGWSASSALYFAVDEFAELLAGDPHLEDRARDLRDLASRVSAELNGVGLGLEVPLNGRVVLVGEDFFPTDIAQFGKAVVGVITTSGGPTSHSAIMLRSMGIPTVINCARAAELVDGQVVLVDPAGDRVLVDADTSLATRGLSLLAKTLDPIVAVRANIGSLDEAVQASASAAAGVGLFRTELLYLAQLSVPSVAEQITSYVEIFSAAPEGPVVVRTIDVTSDKPVPFLSVDPKTALTPGYNLLADNREFVISQLKGIEAARKLTGRDVWVMAPMIASATEAIEFANLAKSVGEFKVGIMVEIPSLAKEILQLEHALDFLSVGTNDLSQFLFETNRLAPLSPELLSPWQPALIQLLAQIAQDGSRAGILSGVCGESASDPVFAIVLAGLGFDSVSCSLSEVAAVRSALCSVGIDRARELAQLALAANSEETARSMVLAALRAH